MLHISPYGESKHKVPPIKLKERETSGDLGIDGMIKIEHSR
jgi:hypothetical protein